MTTSIYMKFIQYLLGNQTSNNIVLNHFPVVEHTLNPRRKVALSKKLNKTKSVLLKSGIIKEHFQFLSVTKEGELYYHQENRKSLSSLMERFTNNYNKKGVALVALITLLVSVAELLDACLINNAVPS